jgi:hypothetical protein
MAYGGKMIPHVMPYDKAVKLGLVQTYSDKIHPMGEYVWRPTLTKEQEEQQKKDVESGRLPF